MSSSRETETSERQAFASFWMDGQDENSLGSKEAALAFTVWQAATLVEREACAEVCEKMVEVNSRRFAAAIRARGNKPPKGAGQ